MQRGDKCWIVENGNCVTVAEILSISGNLCLIRLESGKAIRVPKHRIFNSKEDAEETIPKRSMKGKYRSPHDYI